MESLEHEKWGFDSLLPKEGAGAVSNANSAISIPLALSSCLPLLLGIGS